MKGSLCHIAFPAHEYRGRFLCMRQRALSKLYNLPSRCCCFYIVWIYTNPSGPAIVHRIHSHCTFFPFMCVARLQERPPAEPSPAVGPLSQLLSPQCPALLLVVQACPGPDSRYGFSCCSRGAGQGLVVTQSDHSQLCLEDRSAPHRTQCPLENNASSVLLGGAWV